MSVKKDGVAHDLQNRIDLAMDELWAVDRGLADVVGSLEKIRDEIPCSCGKEVSGDISVETALEVEQVAEWIADSQDCYEEVEWLLTKMSTKDFYDEYGDVLKDLKERAI